MNCPTQNGLLLMKHGRNLLHVLLAIAGFIGCRQNSVFNLSSEEISDGKEQNAFADASNANRVKVDCPTDMTQPPWTYCLEGRIMRGENQGCICRPLSGGADQIIGCPTIH